MDAPGPALMARRALLGAGHLQAQGGAEAADHDTSLGAEAGSSSGSSSGGGTLDVRVIAMFAIAAGALLCGLPPLFMRAFKSPDAPAARVARAFAGGIILALALVHIIPEAVTDLNDVVDFPLGGVAVLAGILALVTLDSSLTALWAPEEYKQQLRSAEGGLPRAQPSAATLKALKSACGHSHGSAPKGGAGHAHAHDGHAHGGHEHGGDAHAHGRVRAHVHADAETASSASGSSDGGGSAVVVTASDLILPPAPPARAHAPADGAVSPHTHSCTSSLSAQRWAGGAGMTDVKQRVTAYTMELGCIFHSVIIGVGVGVITDGRQLVIVLMVALIVHQGLEGMSLGTVLALTHFSRLKKVLMVVMYSVTTSAGIAIGIAASKAYDPGSATSKAVQGTLNGVSGGMLLYISMYQLIAEEFSREDLVVKGRLRAGMVAGLLLGAACMCVLAIWS